ncbi:MAG: DegT/DnrJ/EryC1/StrS family aminotransferase [Desulfobacteraceae bacterium]|jgi:dTDP-4-amino-4,6-dideoxygalactose transaminase|nr:DegT/DnrJ/EryC1/StrS family aminotransferase [Desulfobacteraceae bacterium]
MNVPFLDLKVQYRQIENEVLPMVTEAMQNGAFIGGPQVAGFEEEFAAFCDSRYCVGVGSGTDALRFALMAAGVGAGHEVITVPNTFIATTEAISQAGARPVFVDVDPATCNMDPEKIDAKITRRTKAIVPVHLYGQPADMDPILDIADRHGLAVVEDACQAHGALYKGRKAGSMGFAGCFSFYPGKNLGAFGEGGAIVTQDEATAKQMRMIRDHGQNEKYYHQIEGYNGRLDAIQAGVLRIKLKRLADWNESRRKNAVYYHERLAAIPGIQLPAEADYARSVYHLYVIHADRRDDLQRFLAEKGVATGLHYPRPLHLQAAYSHMGMPQGAFPASEHSARRLLSLPMFAELTREQVDYVADSIKEFQST